MVHGMSLGTRMIFRAGFGVGFFHLLLFHLCVPQFLLELSAALFPDVLPYTAVVAL